MRSIFIHDRHDLEASVPGGVQRCTREFLEIVQAASTQTERMPVSVSRAPLLRLRRLLGITAYVSYRPSAYLGTLQQLLASGEVTHVFINRAELLRFATVIRSVAPSVCIVVMSHGNQSGDDLYKIAGVRRSRRGFRRILATWKLGLDLVTESHFRNRYVDAVCVMSQEEAVLERWLGATQIAVLPRLITSDLLAWEPAPGRVGYVGTLDHTPNRVAIELMCASLPRGELSLDLRLVGGPESIGRQLASLYPFITYLGPLADDELRREAATWSLFLNPVFWLARGASMKLAQGLAWGLPVITTASGRRGYEWQDAAVPQTPDVADEYTRQVLRLLADSNALAEAKAASLAAAIRAPNAAALAERLTTFSRVKRMY